MNDKERQRQTEARTFVRSAMSRRAFLKKLWKSALGVAIAGTGAFYYSFDLETSWIDVIKLNVSLHRLEPDFGGYRIVHITDLHLDDAIEPEYLARIVRLVNNQRPDLIAFTGDFVTMAPERFASDLVSVLSRLEARDGTVTVLGNHDHLAGSEVVSAAVQEGGAINLCNEVHTLRRSGSCLHVCGVDDVWEGRPHLGRVLHRLPNRGAAILLVHEPDFADASAASRRLDLQLSGHSHGGQVRLPLLGAPVLPRYAKKYPMGPYRIRDMLLYTNRGLGMLPPRFRFLCRPEITVLDLNPARGHATMGLR